MGEAPSDRQTIVFTDSRDDAARTAAGVGLNHYRDVIRQLTQQMLADGPLASARSSSEPQLQPLNAAEQERLRRLQARRFPAAAS